MGRPRKTLRPVPLNVSLDEDVAVKLELELWSDLESKVPFGARSLLINKLLRSYFRSLAGKRTAARLLAETEERTKAAIAGVPQVSAEHWAGDETPLAVEPVIVVEKESSDDQASS